MAYKAVVIHRMDDNNVGDMSADPLQYFLKEDQYHKIDVTKIGKEPFPDDVPMIYGGGGLLANEFFGNKINLMFSQPDVMQLENLWENRWFLCNKKYKKEHHEFSIALKKQVVELIKKIRPDGHTTPRIVWGAGHNLRDFPSNWQASDIRYPKALRDFDLIGIRDWWDDDYQMQHPEMEWVPCASCMHPALGKKYPIKNDIIIFEHKKQLIKSSDYGQESVPRFVNSGDNMDQTIELLGSANYIITNSYHGAYWGTLLGKKVMIVGPWTSKFYGFKHRPFMKMKAAGWFEQLDMTRTFPDALSECMNTTENYWNKVKGML